MGFCAVTFPLKKMLCHQAPVSVGQGEPSRDPASIQQDHSCRIIHGWLADHNLDDMLTLLPLPAKMAHRTTRQSRSTHDVLHAPARAAPWAADQASTSGPHEGPSGQHKRTGSDTM